MHHQAALFKALSDPTRLRLAALLAVSGETCVCFLARALDEPDFKISRHLSILRSAGIVTARREGSWMYYRLSEPEDCLDRKIHELLRECLSSTETGNADRVRLSGCSCCDPETCP